MKDENKARDVEQDDESAEYGEVLPPTPSPLLPRKPEIDKLFEDFTAEMNEYIQQRAKEMFADDGQENE